MMNEHKTLTAVKKIIDDDAILKKLLGKQSGSTKVFIGDVEPTAVFPYVTLVNVANPADFETSEGEMSLYVNVTVRTMTNGTVDSKKLSEILDRMADLLQDKQLVVDGHRVFKMYTTGILPTTRHLKRESAFLGGIECKIHAMRL